MTANQRLRAGKGNYTSSSRRKRQPVGERASRTESSNARRDSWLARTLKAVLEHPIGVKVPPDARILCWLVEFAAYLMSRCDIDSDGKTPTRRLHGRRDTTPILELDEKILFHDRQDSERRHRACGIQWRGDTSTSIHSQLTQQRTHTPSTAFSPHSSVLPR